MFDYFDDSINTLIAWRDSVDQVVLFKRLVEAVKFTFENGGKLVFAGNGGSAAEAAHLAAEFIGKCSNLSSPLPAMAVTESSVTFSAITNDYGFENSITRNLIAFVKPADLVILLSTSGTSPNISNALTWLNSKGLQSSLWTSAKFQGNLNISNFTIVAPTLSTARAQELHLILGHILAEEIEKSYLE